MMDHESTDVEDRIAARVQGPRLRLVPALAPSSEGLPEQQREAALRDLLAAAERARNVLGPDDELAAEVTLISTGMSLYLGSSAGGWPSRHQRRPQ